MSSSFVYIVRSLTLAVSTVSFLTSGVDSVDQSVSVFAADTVDELSVGSLPWAVEAPQAGDPTRGPGCGFGKSLPSLEQQNQQEVHQPHGVQHAALVSSQSGLHRVGQRWTQQVLRTGGKRSVSAVLSNPGFLELLSQRLNHIHYRPFHTIWVLSISAKNVVQNISL